MNPSAIRVRIKQSKMDPFQKGVCILLGKTDQSLCLIKGILPYLALRGDAHGPLFLTENNRPLTRQKFYSTLEPVLQQCGLDSKRYNTHSFRIGAATSAREAGIPNVQIQMLDRWKSDTYKQYIKTPRQDLDRLSEQLVSPRPRPIMPA